MSERDRIAQAFEEYSDALFRHCFFRISDRERAVELTQETFLKVWNYAEKGGKIDDIRAFLYRSLNNLIIDEYRKKKSVSLDALLEEEGISEGDFKELKTAGREVVENAFDAKQALILLDKIPEKYRTAVTLRFVEGLSPKEIANLMGETENVISVRIHRGLERLRKEWTHETT